MKVSGVEIHADPWAFYRSHDSEKAIGRSNGVVVFDPEENSLFPCVFGGFNESVDRILFGFFAGDSFRMFPGKNPDVRSSHDRGVINPFFHIFHLLGSFGRIFGIGEIVSNRGSGN